MRTIVCLVLLLGSGGCSRSSNVGVGPIVWQSLPAGSFRLGCSEGATDCESDELPRRSVTVGAFELTRTEITQAQYQAVTGENPSFFQPADPDTCPDCPVIEPCEDCPVEQVDWHEAAAFCARVGGRLPTEAEWEYAARAGTAKGWTCDKTSKLGGATCGKLLELADVAWYSANSGARVQRVATREANAFGLHDTLGNVWEWVADGYSPSHEGAAPDGAARTGIGDLKVLRGGAWHYGAHAVTVSSRSFYPAGVRDGLIGFRCARSVR